MELNVRSINAKVAEAMRAPIIGMVSFDDAEIDFISEKVHQAYADAQRLESDSYIHRIIDWIIILIVHYTKKWQGKEQRYWSNIFDLIFDEPRFQPARIYEQVDRSCRTYRKRIFITATGKRSFYSFFMFHAMVPAVSFKAFIRMIWQALYLDPDLLDAQYTSNDPLIAETVKLLRSRFEASKDDENAFEFDKKFYSISSGLRYAFAQSDFDQFIQILHSALGKMDAIYHNTLASSSNDEFSKLCELVVREIIYNEGINKPVLQGSAALSSITDIAHLQPYYELDETYNVRLIIPAARVWGLNNDSIDILVYSDNDEEPVKRLKRFVVGSDLKQHIEQAEIPVTAAEYASGSSLKLRIRLTEGENTLYDSGRKLDREFILFKNRTEKKGTHFPLGDYYFFVPKEYESDILKQGAEKLPGGCYSIDFASTSYIQIADRDAVFSDAPVENSLNILGDAVEHIQFELDGNIMPVYAEMPVVRFCSASEAQLSNQICLYNNQEYVAPVTELTTAGSALIHTLRIPESTSGIYCLKLVDIRLKKLLGETSFIVINGISLVNDSNTYFYNNQYCAKLEADGFEADVSLTDNSHTFAVQYSSGNLIITPCYIRWRIDQAPWNYYNWHRTVWFRDPALHNNAVLEVDTNFNTGIQLSLNGKSVSPVSDGATRFSLGDALTESAAETSDITLEVGKISNRLFTVTKQRAFIAEPDIFYSDGTLTFNAAGAYIGNSDDTFLLDVIQNTDYGEQKIVARLSSKEYDELPCSGIADGFYDIDVSVVTNGMTGASEELLTVRDVCIGNPLLTWFDGVELTLTKTYVNDKNTRLTNTRIRNIRFVSTDINAVFEGDLYVASRKKPIPIEFTWEVGSDAISLRARPDDQNTEPQLIICQKTDNPKSGNAKKKPSLIYSIDILDACHDITAGACKTAYFE